MNPGHRPRTAVAWLVLLAVALAIWRGVGLPSRGLLEHDEGHNLLAARTYREVLVWVVTGGPFDSDPQTLAHIRDTLHRQGGTLYPAGKPGYVALLAVGSLPVGLSQESALALSWMAGLVCILLAPLILREWGCRNPVAWGTAMAGIGLSPLLGSLSREVGGGIWALTFGLLGLWLMLRSGTLSRESKKRRRVLASSAGVLLGIGFTCHYNLLPLLLAVFAADAARSWAMRSEAGAEEGETSSARHSVRLDLLARWPWAIGGGFTVFLFVQVATQIAETRLRPVYPEYTDYATELIRIVSTYQIPALTGGAVGEGVRGWGPAACGYGLKILWREGLVAVVAVGLALAFLIRRCARGKRRGALSPLVFLGVMAAFWFLHPWKVERSWGMLAAAAWLVVGAWISGFSREPDVPSDPAREKNPAGSREKKTHVSLYSWVIMAMALHAAFLIWGPWGTLWTQASPIPATVRQALAHLAENGGSIQANSAGKSFAPLWKWAVIEEGRRPELQPALDHVDFSRFDRPDIVFLDPRTWEDPDFPATKQDIVHARWSVVLESANPPWRVAAVDIRSPASRK